MTTHSRPHRPGAAAAPRAARPGAMADTGAMDRAQPPPRTADAGGLGIGLAGEDWTGDARFYEYSEAVDPIGSGLTSAIPVRRFPAQWDDPGTTRIVSLDLSDALVTPYPATGPS